MASPSKRHRVSVGTGLENSISHLDKTSLLKANTTQNMLSWSSCAVDSWGWLAYMIQRLSETLLCISIPHVGPHSKRVSE